jgi:pyruvate/2-oxoglutarate dehydrogenase complex dihydrolipoamide dehydrogenase (E3) component
MSLEERFDAIVIVDGFSGYATAYTLTKMGLETLSIEQTLSFANKGG